LCAGSGFGRNCTSLNERPVAAMGLSFDIMAFGHERSEFMDGQRPRTSFFYEWPSATIELILWMAWWPWPSHMAHVVV
jgi:hypothetical protein